MEKSWWNSSYVASSYHEILMTISSMGVKWKFCRTPPNFIFLSFELPNKIAVTFHFQPHKVFQVNTTEYVIAFHIPDGAPQQKIYTKIISFSMLFFFFHAINFSFIAFVLCSGAGEKSK